MILGWMIGAVLEHNQLGKAPEISMIPGASDDTRCCG
jgi:hypothetical protein